MNKLTSSILWLTLWYNQTCIFKIHASQDVYLYSINQTVNLDDDLISNKTLDLNEFELWNNQSYGDLIMSQRASEVDDVPVWKTVEEHLKDIDWYMSAVEEVISGLYTWYDVKLNSGASGVLTLYNGTSSTDKRQLMYSWDTERQLMVPIPKFVYRIIRAHCTYYHENRRSLEDHNQNYNAVIVVHNDPTTGSDGDFFDCESCSGWDAVQNTYPTEDGLTYVCHLTEEMSEILGINDYNPESEPLNLNSMPYSYSDNWEWTSLTCEREYSDQRQAIYEKYQKLKEPCPQKSRNQSECSDDNMITPNSDEIQNPDAFKLWINQSYGILEMSKRAGSEIELVPVWKDVDEHLKDINLYLKAVENVLENIPSYAWKELWTVSGTSGVLRLYNGTRSNNKTQLMYTWNTENECMVPIPKLIYKIFRAHCRYEHYSALNLEPHDKHYNAAIIIHNDPTTGSDDDELLESGCKRLWSWSEIENIGYGETGGLTYVCHFTKELSEILGMCYHDYDVDSEPLNLYCVPYSHSYNWEYTSLTAPVGESDQTQAIYKEYRELKETWYGRYGER